MISVRRVIDAVGLALTIIRPAGDPLVRDVVIADPGELEEIRVGDVVLGPGVGEVATARELAQRCAAAGAAALLLKPPFAAAPEVLGAAGGRMAVVEVQRHLAWAQLVWLLRSVIDSGTAYAATSATDSSAFSAFQDLFAMADAMAAVIDAPVTVEDAHARVLAYSSRQDHVDEARRSTIIGRRVPEEVLGKFRARGVFRKLGQGNEPIFVPGQPDGTLPRFIVPIRIGGEFLGSIWAVVPGPVPQERAQALADTTAVVALHLLRLRAQADVARRIAAERLRAVLYEGDAQAAHELGITADPHRVVALSVREGQEGAEGRRLALWESISRRHGWRQPLIADIDGVLFAVVRDSGEESGSWRWLQRVVAGVTRYEDTAVAAAGGAAADLGGLQRSRAEAEELLGLLTRGVLGGPVAAYDNAWATLVLHRTAAAVPAAELLRGGPLPTLLDHDQRHGSHYVATLRAWLDYQGDPNAASRQLHVHPNTFRYRMKRLAEIVDVDLENPQVRLALMIQLSGLRLGAG